MWPAPATFGMAGGIIEYGFVAEYFITPGWTDECLAISELDFVYEVGRFSRIRLDKLLASSHFDFLYDFRHFILYGVRRHCNLTHASSYSYTSISNVLTFDHSSIIRQCGYEFGKVITQANPNVTSDDSNVST